MANKTVIKDFYGKIIGSLSDEGNKIVAKSFYGTILGHYDKKLNVTKDFYGKVLSVGDITSALVWQEYNEHPF